MHKFTKSSLTINIDKIIERIQFYKLGSRTSENTRLLKNFHDEISNELIISLSCVALHFSLSASRRNSAIRSFCVFPPSRRREATNAARITCNLYLNDTLFKHKRCVFIRISPKMKSSLQNIRNFNYFFLESRNFCSKESIRFWTYPTS